MDIEKFEQLILKQLKLVTEKIIKRNLTLNISAKSRVGAEISSFLEDKFVEETKFNRYLKDACGSSKNATKNPFDAQVYFSFKGHKELIWIDFKAIKLSAKNSNPDIGTPSKIIKFIKKGNFYLTYIIVYYIENKKGLKFVKNNNEFVTAYFLKDINDSFRRNPKNQLQVNINAKPIKRNRADFINILFNKIEESHKRQIQISKKALKKIKESNIKKELLIENSKQEQKIKNL